MRGLALDTSTTLYIEASPLMRASCDFWLDTFNWGQASVDDSVPFTSILSIRPSTETLRSAPSRSCSISALVSVLGEQMLVYDVQSLVFGTETIQICKVR